MPCNKKLLLAGLAALTLTACASTKAQPSMKAGQTHFGKAVAANLNAQKVAPTEEQKANTYIPANRARRNAARQAYEAGEVPEPVPLTTTNGGD